VAAAGESRARRTGCDDRVADRWREKLLGAQRGRGGLLLHAGNRVAFSANVGKLGQGVLKH
jgi:hypothetical protein